MTQPSPPTVDPTTLPETVAEGQTGRLGRTGVLHKAVNQLTAAVAFIYSELTAVRSLAAAAGGVVVPTRTLTTSGAVTPGDASRIVYANFATAGTVALPLSTPTAPWPSDGATLIEVDRVGADVQVVPSLSSSPFQRLTAPRGTKIALAGCAAHLQKPPPAAEVALPSGLWAVIDGEQFAAQAHGTAISTVAPHAASTVTLPPITAAGAQRPSVYRNAINNRTGMAFSGAGQFLPLTGAWLSLLRNRANAAIYITYLVTAAGLTGDKTLVSFSVGGDATKARAMIKHRDNGSGLITVGGRRTDADTAIAFVNAGISASPDVAVAGGRFLWSTSDLSALKNGTIVNTSTTFQTDGNTSDTASAAAAFGANAAGTGEYFQGVMLHAAIGPDTTSLAAQYQAWALARYREDWTINGDVVE